MNSILKHTPFVVAWIAIYAAVAAILAWVVSMNGTYPAGTDVFSTIHIANVIYENAQAGNYFPTFDPLWYNGCETLTFWAPLPPYAYAACIFAASGDALMAYTYFVAALFFISALPWIFMGIKLNRKYLGAFLGLAWFFMPTNLIALFTDGAIPLCMAAAIFPLILFNAARYTQKLHWQNLVIVALATTATALSGLYFAIGEFGILVLMAAIYAICNKSFRGAGTILLSALCGFAMAGVWLVGHLTTDATILPSLENSGFYQSLITTLNPLERLESNSTKYYFGLATFVLCVFGVVCSKKKSLGMFITAIVVLVCTSAALLPLLELIPGTQYAYALKFLPAATAAALMAFLMWDTLKAPFAVVLCALLIVDSAGSLSLIYGNANNESASDRLEATQEYALEDIAQEQTTQRMAMLDGSVLDSESAFLVTDIGNTRAISEGTNANAATTKSNTQQLDRALAGGNFLYVFDRALELGCDTVLIRNLEINGYNWDETNELLDEAAGASNYTCIKKSLDYRLYKLDTQLETWGTKSTYNAIGIGSSAGSISLFFPSVEETTNTNINDYTYDQLKAYKTVFLSGFTYTDKTEAEALVKKLSEGGTRVVILADGIPVENGTHDMEFLGVRCNSTTFTNGYPELNTIDGKLVTDLFPQDSTTWNTVFLDGLDNVWGTFDTELEQEFDFYGTKENDNIIFVGLNLTYFLSITQDASVEALLSHAINISNDELPTRKIVPVSATYHNNKITLSCEENGVNTALAWHNSFNTTSEIYAANNLTYINSGQTVIEVTYPHFAEGAAVSVAGVICLILLCVAVCRPKRQPQSQRTKELPE